MNKKHITIHDIARELEISASTVSRALHGHPRISEATRKAVSDLAEKYHYQPNVVASSLRQGKSSTVGVVVPRINRFFFASIIGGMEEVLASAGYHLIICQSHEQLKGEMEAVKTLVDARVDAIFLSISLETRDNKHLKHYLDKGIRIFFFDRVLKNSGIGSVTCDDRKAAYRNVRHLIDQGYKRIYHVTGSEQINIYRNRKQGYLDAMDEAGLEVRDNWIIEKPLVAEGGESAFAETIQNPDKPEAFFCAGDYAALGVMQAALKAGIKVPEDLGVSGFANEPFTAYLDPSITTVDQQGPEMGKRVAQMFLDCQQQGGQSRDFYNHVLEPQLISRESTNKQ